MTDQANPVRWGILGAARIADGAILPGIGKSAWARAHAIAARDLTRAQAMAEKHAIARAYGSYEALLADPEV
ncbi:MAG: gfo/Idh/MocA family oxidoreductase, partial [Paracoccus sp. (in: a-proteobacteria)]